MAFTRALAVFVILLLSLSSLFVISFSDEHVSAEVAEKTRSGARAQDLVFVEYSTGLPTSGSLDFAVLGDFNNDGDYDIIFSAQDGNAADATKSGLYAYTGNGGTAWTNASAGLWRGNSWAGIDLADADNDGYMEYYATDDNHGTNNNSGVKVWEYRSGSWTDSAAHVSTPLKSGRPNSVMLINISGDERPDMVVANGTGMKYFENQGGNPVTWRDISTGLPSSGMYTAVDVADMNKDGLADIVCCDYSDNERLFIQNTTGSFHWSEYSSGVTGTGNCLGVELADVNNDTHMDIVFGCRGNGLYCILGNSGGVSGTSFSWTAANTNLPTGNHYYDLKVADIDVDGDMDIITPCYSNRGIRIYLGNGNTNPGLTMTWTEATNTNLTLTDRYISVDVEDVNNDGSLDIAAASWGDGVKFYLNNISLDVTAPGSISDLAVQNITTTSIEVNWTAPADNGTDTLTGPVKSYDIRYHTSTINTGNWASAVECTGEPAPAAPGTDQKYNITGLQPGTRYYIAMRSADERPNYSPLSNVVTAVTLGLPDTTPPEQIIDLQAVEPTNNSINLTWTAPADNGSDSSSGFAAEYDIRYSTGLITSGNWDSAAQVAGEPAPRGPGESELLSVTGLISATTYYFALKASDEKPNWGGLSNVAFNTTLVDPDVIPPSSITDLEALTPTNNTMDLTWTAPGGDGDIGVAVEYDIRYSTATITDGNWVGATVCANPPTPNSQGETEQYTVDSLLAETTYYFAIKASDDVPLWSTLSNVASNTTLASPDETAPEGIPDLAAQNPTTDSIELTWTAPGDDEDIGQAAAYDIRYASDSLTTSAWTTAAQVASPPTPGLPGSTEVFTVTSLAADTTYYFAIKSSDEVPNWSPLSNVASGTTLEQTGPPVIGLDLKPEKTELNSSESMQLKVEVFSRADLAALAGATVNITANDPGLEISPAEGLSDADGIITVTVTAPIVTTVTIVDINVTASKAGYLTGFGELIISVNPVSANYSFNLRIIKDDITLSFEPVKHEDSVTLFAEVRNDGLNDAGAFSIKFFIDGTQLGEDVQFHRLNKGDSVVAQIKWTADSGEHIISVGILAANPALESNTTDNFAEKTISVLERDEEPEPDPEPGDEEEEKDKDKEGISPTITGLILAIIIILITILVFFMMRRKDRKKDDFGLPPTPLPPSLETEEVIAEPLDEGALATEELESETPPEELPIAEPAEPTEPAQPAAPVQPAQPVEPAEPIEPAQPPAPVQPAEPAEPAEPIEPAEPTESSEAVPAAAETVPCPTCGNPIEVYAPACASCSTEMDWRTPAE